MGNRSYELGLSEARRHEATAAAAQEFHMLGLQWDLLPEVFAPHRSQSTASYTGWLPFPRNGSFLEMGCGAGVTAVYAALTADCRVTAADINPAAVATTQANARRHGVADRVQAVHSDMFDALPDGQRFDVIFWNSSAIAAPPSFSYTRDIEWSIFDRDYECHRRYLREGPTYLTEGGRLFLGFNTNGDYERLTAEAREAGLRIREHRSMTTTYNDNETKAKFMLLELTPEP